MYPDLSYLLHDLIGTPVDNWISIVKTFGFLLVLAFLASMYFFKKELKRKEEEGLIKGIKEKITIGAGIKPLDLGLNVLMGFILGFKIVYLLQHFKEIGEDLFAFIFSMEGNMLAGVVGAALFGGMYWWEKNKQKLPKPKIQEVYVAPHERAGDITIRAAISGILGAKLFAIFESTENIRAFLNDPLGQFFSGSGLAIYGGLIVAFIYIYWYVNRKGIKPIHVMDAVAPALIMGYAVGRIGCQLSGDGDWGIDNTLALPSWWFLPEWMWAYDYPHNVLQMGLPIEGCESIYCNRLATPVFPTPFYETIAGLVIFLILWVLRKKIKIAGVLFFIYLIFNGLERFYVEKIRINDKIDMFGMQLTQAEIISFLLFFIGIIGCVVLYARHKRSSSSTA
jgi:prolipoprotein diacylglyceryl transferase